MFHYIPTNLVLRQGLWWPMCPLLCSAAPVDHGFETFEMLLQNPTALIVLSWAELLSLPSIPSGPHPPSMLDTWLNAFQPSSANPGAALSASDNPLGRRLRSHTVGWLVDIIYPDPSLESDMQATSTIYNRAYVHVVCSTS